MIYDVKLEPIIEIKGKKYNVILIFPPYRYMVVIIFIFILIISNPG